MDDTQFYGLFYNCPMAASLVMFVWRSRNYFQFFTKSAKASLFVSALLHSLDSNLAAIGSVSNMLEQPDGSATFARVTLACAATCKTFQIWNLNSRYNLVC